MHHSQIYSSFSKKYQKKISVVITVYNEQDNIMPLANALYTVLDAQAYDYEIIFVDDGSVDDTYKILRRAQTKICNLTIIPIEKKLRPDTRFFRRVLLRRQATTSSVWTAIWQNDPQDIPQLLEAIEGKHDAICGWAQTTAKTLQPNDSFRRAFNPHPLSHLRGPSA